MGSALGGFDTEGCVAAGAALPRDVVATLGSFREPEELLKAFQRAIDQRRW